MIPAREVLTVVAGGEFRPGVIAFGLRGRGTPGEPEFPLHAWPGSTGVTKHLLYGEDWEVIEWDIEILQWPQGRHWRDVVKRTLTCLIDAGAVVAWLGQEGFFASPPDLFSPRYMTGMVFAVLTETGEFACPIDPDKPLASLSDAQLLRLRAIAKGLADAK